MYLSLCQEVDNSKSWEILIREILFTYLFVQKKKKEREREISWRSFKICKRVCFIGEVKDEKNKFESNCEQIWMLGSRFEMLYSSQWAAIDEDFEKHIMFIRW